MMKTWGPCMKHKYFGSIMSFKNSIEYDFIEVNHVNTIKLKKEDVYHIKLNFDIKRITDNYYKHTNARQDKIIVSYIKSVPANRSIGILRYFEFKDLEFCKNEVVDYEIYEIRVPFEIEEYYDGVFLYIKIENPNIFYQLKYPGYIENIGLNVYKLFYTTGDIYLYGEEFLFSFKPSSITSLKFSFYMNKEIMQININLESLHKINKFQIEKYILEKHNEGKEINFVNVLNLMTDNLLEVPKNFKMSPENILEEEKNIIRECYLDGHENSSKYSKESEDEYVDDETFVENLKYKYLNSLNIKESEDTTEVKGNNLQKISMDDLLDIFTVSESSIVNLYLEKQYYIFKNILLYNSNIKDLQNKENKKCIVVNSEILIEEKGNIISINNHRLAFIHSYHFFKNQ